MFTVLRPRFWPNWTAPAARANSVSSLPRPTLTPGWNLVPRWRTRISPALTCWPPKRLTPRYWALESRPLRELDAPFLCAISVQLLLGLDVGDLDAGQLLPVTLPLVVAGLVLELVDLDLGALGLGDDLAGHRDLGQRVGVGGDGPFVDDEQRGERELGARLTVELLNLDDVANGDLVLLAAGLDDRVHRTQLSCYSTASENLGATRRPGRDDTGLAHASAHQRGGPTYRIRACLGGDHAGGSHRASLTPADPPAGTRHAWADAAAGSPGSPERARPARRRPRRPPRLRPPQLRPRRWRSQQRRGHRWRCRQRQCWRSLRRTACPSRPTQTWT